MIQCVVKGDFKKTMNFLKRVTRRDLVHLMDKYGKEGVDALKAATPVRTGKTAASWDYCIVKEKNRISIFWTNSNIQDGTPIAVIINYGHGTATGGYVEGRQYIEPAIQPVFDKIADAAWKEVNSNDAV